MKEKSLFEKKFKKLFTITLVLTLSLISLNIILDIDKFAFFFLGITILIVIIALLYFSYISLKLRQTINYNQYSLFVLAISLGTPTFPPFNSGSRILQVVILGLLLFFYGRYRLDLDTKKGKEAFAKRVSYLCMAVVLVLFLMLLRLFLKYKGLYL